MLHAQLHCLILQNACIQPQHKVAQQPGHHPQTKGNKTHPQISLHQPLLQAASGGHKRILVGVQLCQSPGALFVNV